MSASQHVETAAPQGPHAAIPAKDLRERFALRLFDALWARYRSRVEHVAAYERVTRDAGATFVNDHIAFRTFATQQPLAGIASLSRIFEALGYEAAGCYQFPDKHLGAIHYQHPNCEFPKLFISELKTWELPRDVGRMIAEATATHRDPVPLDTLVQLSELAGREDGAEDHSELLAGVVQHFHELPWQLPEKSRLEALAAESQYAAWVLVHGYNVNHFTSLINSHRVETLDDIEKTIAALKAAGVPMKDEIEGEPGSKLRQSATAAAVIDVPVLEDGRETTTPWTYAYFELAEHGEVTDPQTGQPTRFEGFLGPQATNLFEMTRVKQS